MSEKGSASAGYRCAAAGPRSTSTEKVYEAGRNAPAHLDRCFQQKS